MELACGSTCGFLRIVSKNSRAFDASDYCASEVFTTCIGLLPLGLFLGFPARICSLVTLGSVPRASGMSRVRAATTAIAGSGQLRRVGRERPARCRGQRCRGGARAGAPRVRAVPRLGNRLGAERREGTRLGGCGTVACVSDGIRPARRPGGRQRLAGAAGAIAGAASTMVGESECPGSRWVILAAFVRCGS